jgi:hypothetical protein
VALLVALAAALSCSPDLRGTTVDYQLLVFPGEAELGSSAAAIIGSNYIPGADSVEDYQLEKSRIDVEVEDASNVDWDATVRSVFPISLASNSRLAETFPGAWATVVLFDLPDDPGFDLDTGPPFQADVIVSIDGVQQLTDGAVGSIVVTGTNGEPTSAFWYGGLASFGLDDVLVRFRAVLDPDGQSGGFPVEAGGTVIAGLEADVLYFGPCFEDLRAHTGSEAVDAGVYVGGESIWGGGGGGWYRYQHLVLTDPEGFTLLPPSGGATDALGQGPILDLSFDRPNQSIFDCDAIGPVPLWLVNVYAVRPDGSTIVDQRGTGTLGVTSDLFELHPLPIPPEP